MHTYSLHTFHHNGDQLILTRVCQSFVLNATSAHSYSSTHIRPHHLTTALTTPIVLHATFPRSYSSTQRVSRVFFSLLYHSLLCYTPTALSLQQSPTRHSYPSPPSAVIQQFARLLKVPPPPHSYSSALHTSHLLLVTSPQHCQGPSYCCS